jgi:DNA-directed RNA polymerase specialized sigma24 family protein
MTAPARRAGPISVLIGHLTRLADPASPASPGERLTAISLLIVMGQLGAVAYQDEAGSAGRSAAARFAGNVTDGADLGQDAAVLIMTRPHRYLVPGKVAYLRRNLELDVQRSLGDRLGAKRSGAAQLDGNGFRERYLNDVADLEAAGSAREAERDLAAALLGYRHGRPMSPEIWVIGRDAGSRLSAAEKHVLLASAEGLPQHELAMRMGVSVRTVRRLTVSARAKLAGLREATASSWTIHERKALPFPWRVSSSEPPHGDGIPRYAAVLDGLTRPAGPGRTRVEPFELRRLDPEIAIGGQTAHLRGYILNAT